MSNSPKSPRRRGRGPLDRAAASARALRRIAFDPSQDVDEVAILRTIASDMSLAPTARVAACRALSAARGRVLSSTDSKEGDDLNRRALKLLRGGKV